VTGDSTELADWFTPYGEPVNPTGTDVVGFGYRSELQIDGRVHLRARDLAPGLARFTSTDPLDGKQTTVVETNPYHYANNDPINLIDPLGLEPQAVDAAVDPECRAATQSFTTSSFGELGVFGRVEVAGFIPGEFSYFFPVVDLLALYEGDNRDWSEGTINPEKSRFFLDIDFLQGTVFVRVTPTKLVNGGCAGDAWPIELGSFFGNVGLQRVNKFSFQGDGSGTARIQWSVVHSDRRPVTGDLGRIAFDGVLTLRDDGDSQTVSYRGDSFPRIEAYSFSPDGTVTTIFQQYSKPALSGLTFFPPTSNSVSGSLG